MDKTFLEKRIEERAEERFEEELIAFTNFVVRHPIGAEIRVKTVDDYIPLANFGRNYGLVNATCLKNSSAEMTNLAEVKARLIEKYVKEETDVILKKLTTIEYLYNELEE